MADISLTPIVQTESAINLVKFTKTIYYSSYVILSKSNQFKVKTDLIDHAYKINVDIWLTLILCFVAIILVNYFDFNNKNMLATKVCWHFIYLIFVQSKFSMNWVLPYTKTIVFQTTQSNWGQTSPQFWWLCSLSYTLFSWYQ